MTITFKSSAGYSSTKDIVSVGKPENSLCKFQTSWFLNRGFGKGEIKKIEIRPGFDMYISDYYVKESFSTNFDCKKSAFSFSFMLSGETKALSSSIPLKYFKCSRPKSMICYYPDQTGAIKDLSDSHKLMVVLIIEPEQLYNILGELLGELPSEFSSFLEGSLRGVFANSSVVTPEMVSILEQLFYSSYNGQFSKLFYESKAIELLAIRLEQMTASYDTRINPCRLSKTEIDKIHFAASMISADLENPPSLCELTASTGISHTKLNSGFKSIFGTTAFGYLRQMRLKRAKMFLEQGLNVTESAFAVGYNSLSSFTRAFRDQYGCNPNDYIIRKNNHT